MGLSLQDRADAYNAKWPVRPSMWVSQNWLMGVWNIGACYKGTGYYGEFPYGYLDRLMVLWSDKKNILHLFSGSLPAGPYTRVDINPAVSPDVVCSAEEVAQFVKGPFDLVIADPPYQRDDAVRYGYKLPNKAKVMREIAKVVNKGDHLCWLDERLPMYRKTEWKRISEILVTRSTNHRVRATFIFERQ